MTQRPSRTTAEWITFAVSCVVLLGLIAVIVVLMVDDDDAAAPVARPVGTARVVGGRYFVDVEVSNQGDATASNVQVTAELVIRGDVASADQTVDFLAGGEVEDLVFAFDDPPTDGELSISVTGFSLP